MTRPTPSLSVSLIVVAASALTVSVGLLGFGGEVPVPVLMLLACLPPAIGALALGQPWSNLEDGMVHGMTLALQALLILLVVGATIGTWCASGTIATMIDLGLMVLQPAWFLPAALATCGVVSVAIGSSWATAGTVGVALMGIGGALGLPPEMTAGAVLSGAYFGDKMSPLSDTTNLAPAIAGTDLFAHIRAMFSTTLPALCVALVGFAILGTWQVDQTVAPAEIAELRAALASAQHLGPLLLLPPVAVVGLAVLRLPALPTLVLAALFGALLAIGVQGETLSTVLAAMYSGHVSSAGHEAVDSLLSRGGMAAMHDTVALILTATAFGGLLEGAGFIETLLAALLTRVQSAGGLVAATLASAIGVNVLIAEQYLAIVLPGRMFKDAYAQEGLSPTLLSRSLEDSATVTSPLVPWNSCGAYMAATLGVSTFAYLPYALFNLAMPAIALTYAGLGWFLIRDEQPADAA